MDPDLAELVAFLSDCLADDERELRADPPVGMGYALLPARMMHEVEVKRRMLIFLGSLPLPEVYGPMLRWMASVYRDLPGYRAEWKP